MTGVSPNHTVHGIMMQEVITDNSEDHAGSVPEVPTMPRNKERFLNPPVKEDLPVCYVGQRRSPNYPVVHKVVQEVRD